MASENRTPAGFAIFRGGPFGRRVITNPVEPGGDDETNRGTWLRLDGDNFTRMPGGGYNFRAGGAFISDDEGWLEGPAHVTRSPEQRVSSSAMRESADLEITTSFSTSESRARSGRPPLWRCTRSFIRSETWAEPASTCSRAL